MQYDTDCSCEGPPVSDSPAPVVSDSESDSPAPVVSDSDSVAIVDFVFDHILDQVMYFAEDGGPMEGNVTLHDSSPWEHWEDVVEEVVMEEAMG